jgi:hypothetical protein
MRPVLGSLDPPDFELERVALFEMMDAPVEREEEIQAVVQSAPIHIT